MGITIDPSTSLVHPGQGPPRDATVPEPPRCSPVSCSGAGGGLGQGGARCRQSPLPHPRAPQQVASRCEKAGRNNVVQGGQSLAPPEVTVQPWRRRASPAPPGEVPTRPFSPRGDTLPGGAAPRRTASAAHDVDGSSRRPQEPPEPQKQGVLGPAEPPTRSPGADRTPSTGPPRPIETANSRA